MAGQPLKRGGAVLPPEIENAIGTVTLWIDHPHWDGNDASILRAAILKYGDQRYQEGRQDGIVHANDR